MNNWTYKRTIGTIILVLLVIWILFKPSMVLGIIGKIFGVLKPFIVGAAIAFIMNELLKLLEKGWKKAFKNSAWERNKQLMRPVCLLLSFIGICAIFALLVLIIIPEMSNTIVILKDSFPAYVDSTEKFANDIVVKLNKYGFEVKGGRIDFDLIKEKATATITAEKTNIINGAIDATTSVFSMVVNAVLAIVFALFILADKENLGRRFDKLFKKLLAADKYEKLIEFLSLCNKSFSKFVTGQLTEAVIIGCLCFLGMLLLRLPYASAISVLVGFTALIPMVGAFLGTAIGAFMIFWVKPIQALWFIIFIIVLQQLEGNFIYPKVVGKSVGLPGIWVLFVVAVGGSLFGLAGMLIAVPIASVVYELLRRYVNKPKGIKE